MKRIRWMAAVAALGLALVGGPVAAAPQMTVDEAASLYARMAASPEFLRRLVETVGIPGERGRIVAEAIGETFSDRRVARYVAEQMESAGLLDSGSQKTLAEGLANGQRFAEELFGSLGIKGAMRLGAAERREFLQHLSLVLEIVPVRDCRDLIVRGDWSWAGSSPSEREAELIMRMPVPAVRKWYALMRRAVIAEIEGYPPAPKPTETQTQYGMAAFGRAIEKEFLAMPRRDAERIARAMAQLEGAPDRDACDCGRMMVRALLRTKGQTGDWAILAVLGAVR